MNNYLKFVEGAPVTTLILKGAPTANKNYSTSMDYPVDVGGTSYIWTATANAVAMLERLQIKFGQTFRVQKVSTENGSRYRIWDASGVEAILEKGKASGKSGGGYQKAPYKRDPEETANIMSQWATSAAIQSLQYLGRASTDEELITESKRVYLNKVDMKKFILDDINERKEGSQS
jgi:hypothetical protein